MFLFGENIFLCQQVSIQELYEAKVQSLEEQLAHAQHQITTLHKENSQQKDLNKNVQRAMVDMKTKYDNSASSWANERKEMSRNMEKV